MVDDGSEWSAKTSAGVEPRAPTSVGDDVGCDALACSTAVASWSWSWSWSGRRGRRSSRMVRDRCSRPCRRRRGRRWGRRGTVGAVRRVRCGRCRRRPGGRAATPPRATRLLLTPWRSASHRRRVPGRRRAALHRRERRRRPACRRRPVERVLLALRPAWPTRVAQVRRSSRVGWAAASHCSVGARWSLRSTSWVLLWLPVIPCRVKAMAPATVPAVMAAAISVRWRRIARRSWCGWWASFPCLRNHESFETPNSYILTASCECDGRESPIRDGFSRTGRTGSCTARRTPRRVPSGRRGCLVRRLGRRG